MQFEYSSFRVIKVNGKNIEMRLTYLGSTVQCKSSTKNSNTYIKNKLK